MNQEKRAYLFIFGAVLAISFSAPLIKVALGDGTPPVIVAFYRLFITTMLVLPITLGNTSYRNEIRSLRFKDILILTISGFFLALHFFTWISSLRYTSTFGSTVLVCMQPIFVVAGSYLIFHEKTSRRSLWGGFLAIAGMVVIGIGDWGGHQESLWGDGLALMGAFFVAGYLLCGRELRKRMSLFVYIFIVYGICSLVLLAGASLMAVPLYPYSPKSFLVFFALAVLCTILGHSVLNWSLQYIKATVVSVSSLGEPIGAALWAFLFFQEKPSYIVILGGLFILLGIIFFTLSEAKHQHQEMIINVKQKDVGRGFENS